MSPIVHLELSWLVAQPLRAVRDRRLVTAAGIAADLDGLSLLGGLDAYGRWHHVLAHGIVAAAAVAAACALAGRQRGRSAALALVAFHLHLACDFVGSGPGWTIAYLWPFSPAEWGWAHAWALEAWPNQLIGMAATLAVLAMALPLGRTAVELFSQRADGRVVETIRRRVGWARLAP